MTTTGKIIVGTLSIGTAYLIYRYIKTNATDVTTQPESSLPYKTGFPLSFGSRGENVKLLQRALMSLGGNIAQDVITTGGADGIWGPGTDRARKAAGLPANITESKLMEFVKNSGISISSSTIFPLKLGSTGDEVKNLQKVLIAKGGLVAGYINTSGGADGKWGAGTERAIKAAGYPNVIDESKYNQIVKTFKILPIG